MGNKIFRFILIFLCLSLWLMAATEIQLKDPKNDDKGPGNYTYPTDPIYVGGSFDLTKAIITDKGDVIEFKIYFDAPVTFNWGDFWDVQQLQIYLDFDHVAGSGYTETIPGTQVMVDPADAWEKVVFIDPHTVAKINGEIELKAGAMKMTSCFPAKSNLSENS